IENLFRIEQEINALTVINRISQHYRIGWGGKDGIRIDKNQAVLTLGYHDILGTIDEDFSIPVYAGGERSQHTISYSSRKRNGSRGVTAGERILTHISGIAEGISWFLVI